MLPTEISENRLKGMRFQYWLTATVATLLGLAIILSPKKVMALLQFKKDQDQLMFGVSGSVYLAFGLLSYLGLRSPVKWSPILALQLLYKAIWFLGVVGLMMRRGLFSWRTGFSMVAGYAVFVAGDLFAVPFRYLLKKDI
ncbi:MAG: hypothetical protein J7L53_05855 [Deltaproteobacteria bacterium]|nr:hypothetical protein [Deltaproteobacteria bacterium]